MRETFSVSRFVSTSCRFMVRRRVNTACERDELHNRNVSAKIRWEGGGHAHVSFMLVAATVRALFPSSISVIMSS
jgi:hypothetical protein